MTVAHERGDVAELGWVRDVTVTPLWTLIRFPGPSHVAQAATGVRSCPGNDLGPPTISAGTCRDLRRPDFAALTSELRLLSGSLPSPAPWRHVLSRVVTMTAVLLSSAIVTIRPGHAAEDTVPPPATTEQLLRRRDELPAGDPVRDAVRGRVIDDNLPLARRLARRYAGRGEPLEDLTQVAVLALVKAVDKYDTSRDSRFVSYAIPSILGALKRHFRDTGWGVRVSRTVQELVLAVRATSGDLGHRLGRSPTSAELAEYLDVPVDRLLAAQAAVFAYRPGSLDVPATGVDGVGAADLVKALGRTEPRYDAVDDRLTIRALVAALPERDRRIVTMRFFDGMTQTQIAAAIGVSQMQVSRLLRQCLDRLHLAMTSDRAGSSGVRAP